MAKVLKRLLNETKDRMTDEEFFTSLVMKQHFESIIEGVCKTFNRNIQIKVINEGSLVACTDGNTVTVNLNNDWIKNQPTRIDKYYTIVGTIIHECGHILYTDINLLAKCLQALEKNRLFPVIPYSMALEEYFDEGIGRKFSKIYKTLDNCIEDGHIEKRILRYVPGYGECLLKVRRMHLLESGAVTYEMALEKGSKIDRISCIVSLVLIYAKFGIDNTGDVTDDITDLFNKMVPLIDTAVDTNNSVSRKREVNIIFDMLIEFIQDEIESARDSEEDPSEDKSGDPSESDEEGSIDRTDDDPAKEDKEDGSEESTDPGTDDDSHKKEGSKEEISKEEMEKELDKALDGLKDICDEMSEKTDHSGITARDVSDEDDAPFGEYSPEEGMDSEPENEEGPADWDLSYLEYFAAEEELAKATKKRIVKAMSDNAEATRKERTDKFPSIQKYVEPDEASIYMFNCEHEELDRIARRVVKNLNKVIKERQKGDKLTGLYTGKTLDSARTYRKDKRIFSNKVLPEDTPDMEVCVLVDCSGSMSYGTRMEQSRKCAYVTWKFCKIMGIPCSVYGHTTDSIPERHVVMTCVAHPDNLDKLDEKRIFMLRPENNNRDGWAVNFCAEALSRSRAASKLLLIISDGLPAAIGYGEVLGKRDCQEVVKRYKKKGISIVTAGIDDCAADIKSLYVDGVSPKDSAKFLDYSDMSKLPKAFATLIKKELL